MSKLLDQFSGLSAEQRALFLKKLQTKGLALVGSAEASDEPPLVPVSRDEPLPLSFAQRRLWFLSQMEGASQAYHILSGLRMSGPLDRLALRLALNRSVARHEALRTSFVRVAGEPVQRIAPPHCGFNLTEHDLRDHPDAIGEVQRLAGEEALNAFDLEAGPLIRGQLIQLAATEHVLLVTMHHIISDGWSMGILTNELSTLYRAYSLAEPEPLPPLAIQYADYAAWQRRWLAGDVLQAQQAYWRKTLAGAPVLLELCTDRPRPAEQDNSGSSVVLELDASLSAAVRQLNQRHGTTMFMTLLAAWGTVLARLSGQTDIVIGTPVANRTRTEVEPLIGLFVNTLALRLDLSGSPTVAELLRRVRAQALDAQHNQDLPFEQVVEIVKPPRSLAHSPLFQVMFSWGNSEGGELSLPGLTLAPVGVPHVAALFDLSLNLAEAGERIVGELEYATALFDRATIERYLACLRQVLQAMVSDATQRVDRLPMLDASERRLQLEEWNATQAAYPSEQCIHELFEGCAAAQPREVALEHEGQHLSYGELNAQANRLARYLRGLGVGPDTRVAVCMERGFEWVVGLLAI